jgi:S-sulfo-L-cysteine synthase (3-phospho-L-serine-dependent)
MSGQLVLVESNTTGTGRLFARAARELGLEPILLASDPARYPFAAEDGVRTLRVETGDGVAVAAACRELDGSVAGVTSSSEYFIGTAAAVALVLGLDAPDPAAIHAARDKGVQRAVLARAGVPIPQFEVAASKAEAAAACRRIGPPVVVKPVAGTGSVGVSLCNGADAVKARAAELLAVEVNERGMPVPRQILVERFVGGPEYSVEILDRAVAGITRKHLGTPPRFVETGHDFPAPLSGRDAGALERAALAALDALGLTLGPAHVELRLEDGEPYLIEVNPRLAGGFIPELVRRSRGVDLIRGVVARAAGRDVSLVPVREDAVSIRFVVADAPAVVVEGDKAARRAGREDGVLDATIYLRPGTRVVPHGDFRDRVGHVIARGGNSEESGAAADRALRTLEDALIEDTSARENAA